jgi:hypothetical protein
MDDAIVRRDVEVPAGDGGAMAMDLYLPPGAAGPFPAVVIVAGYPDPSCERAFGCRFKEIGSTVSWGRLLAASGLAAVAYANREPQRDLRALLDHLRRDAGSFGVDGRRLGLWASSGNAPLALSALMEAEPGALRCAALLNGFTLDMDDSTAVAEAAARWGFANPCAGRSIDDLPQDLPLFLVRSGRDEIPGLNDAMDRFAAAALRRNLPMTLVNHPEAPHAFDLFHDSDTSREVVREVLVFLRFHLAA